MNYNLLRLPILMAVTCLALIASASSYAAELVIQGTYQGTNLYIQNSADESGNFCIERITVNDKELKTPSASAFEIDLSYLEKNTDVTIRIFHRSGCEPKILNPNAIKQKSNFAFTFTEATPALITWKTTGEVADSYFVILKREHSEWKEYGLVYGKGSGKHNAYEFKVVHHSGENLYQIQYVRPDKATELSPVVDYMAELEQVSFFPQRVSKMLHFSREVNYMVMDKYGKVVMKGTAKEVDCGELQSGSYHISYDNTSGKFFKK
ncbi:hypothetical protein V6R21_18170 [Limibacter armeniacum]|uniref:hypothetical protein n=1 Tax=Limibacter armeniacum TaxID=466084 RepID=UPI002FE5FBC0